jgi:hypothetical protein
MRTLQLRQLNDNSHKCGDILIRWASIAGEGRGRNCDRDRRGRRGDVLACLESFL